jgi:hypothetical protein
MALSPFEQQPPAMTRLLSQARIEGPASDTQAPAGTGAEAAESEPEAAQSKPEQSAPSEPIRALLEKVRHGKGWR